MLTLIIGAGFAYADTCTQLTVDDNGVVHPTIVGGEGFICAVSGGRCLCAKVNGGLLYGEVPPGSSPRIVWGFVRQPEP